MPIEGDFFYEDYTRGAGSRFHIDELIFEGRTDFQEVIIFQNEMFGRILVLDDVVQVTTSDEFIYHEMLTHTPMLALDEVKSVLIVGGADGGILREALRHEGSEATLVDIDPQLIDLCKMHLAEVSQGAFDDPRAHIVAGDGFEFVRSSDAVFDVIICDGTDPLGGPGDVLFSTEFFEACKSRLRPGGVLVTQFAVLHHDLGLVPLLRRTLGEVFADMRLYTATLPCFFGGAMYFGWGCDDPRVRKTPSTEISWRLERSEIKLRYYTPEIHAASFAIPRFLRDLFQD